MRVGCDIIYEQDITLTRNNDAENEWNLRDNKCDYLYNKKIYKLYVYNISITTIKKNILWETVDTHSGNQLKSQQEQKTNQVMSVGKIQKSQETI